MQIYFWRRIYSLKTTNLKRNERWNKKKKKKKTNLWEDFYQFSQPLKAIAKNTKRVWSGIATKLKDKKGTIDIFDYFVEIYPRVIWMPFPAQENIEIIGDFLNTNFANNYFVWNISEHSYDTSIFNDQVMLKN